MRSSPTDKIWARVRATQDESGKRTNVPKLGIPHTVGYEVEVTDPLSRRSGKLSRAQRCSPLPDFSPLRGDIQSSQDRCRDDCTSEDGPFRHLDSFATGDFCRSVIDCPEINGEVGRAFAEEYDSRANPGHGGRRTRFERAEGVVKESNRR